MKNKTDFEGINANELDYKKVEGYILDTQQISCIENDSMNTLVVAGAGTGKTTTIIGKIKWILRNWKLRNSNEPPPKILVISFTRASKEELERRILTEILQDDFMFKIYRSGDFVEVETFHSLALRIVKNMGDKKTKLTETGFEEFLEGLAKTTKETKVAKVAEITESAEVARVAGAARAAEMAEVAGAAEPNLTEDKIERLGRLYSLMRNYHIDFSEIREAAQRRFCHFWQKGILLQNLNYLRELGDFAQQYQEYLRQNRSLDFTGLLEEAQRLSSPDFSYDYVIIDEYQDISPLEYRLIKNLRKIRRFKLFCVGDDWQTIYQFAGSEISLILNFEKCWGETQVFKIEQTYRFSEKLAELSGKFIMQNKNQLVKQIHGIKRSEADQIVEINGPSERTDLNALYYFLLALPKNSSIFLIGRYNFDIRKISRCEFLQLEKHDGKFQISMRERPDLRISFLSAHKSKGLQADYVLIINCRDATLGFPSQVKENDLTELVHNLAVARIRGQRVKKSEYEFAEERRLFYVAITRARKKVIFLTVKEKESSFILELRENENLKTYTLDF